MVIRESDNHDRPNDDLAVYHDRFVLDCVHAWCRGNRGDSVQGSVAMEGAYAGEENTPRTATWGKLMMGVPYSDPKTPPLELKTCSSATTHG
jgi:hypothetical protein